VRQVALLLSGDGGWSRDLGAIAYQLSGEGTLTAGIDLPPLFANLARDPASCVSPDTDLADLARYLQDRYHLPHTAPLLIGHSAGATLAYTSIAQAPGGTFSGALTKIRSARLWKRWDFSPRFPGRILCLYRT
jgi:type IV secretory pathway VirJ component